MELLGEGNFFYYHFTQVKSFAEIRHKPLMRKTHQYSPAYQATEHGISEKENYAEPTPSYDYCKTNNDFPKKKQIIIF